MRSIPEATWRKSSYSGGSGGNCLEIAVGNPTATPVRDSKNPDGPTLRFQAAAWSAFIAALKTS
ncbi:DUF397 domain-containing protein [Streptomyces sp. NPDC048232]|uniref:DUF397 domain-containing protein n=1 Tax=Streptomyces sp. NPDC048232 TaxID=3365520 RepID=UPI0037180E0F